MKSLAQLVFDRWQQALRTAAPVRRRLWGAARRLLVTAGDPPVTWEFEGVPLRLPLSHALPLYRALYPHYGAAVGCIAAAAQRKYPELTAIDIGANVGDTAAVIRRRCPAPLLCIEASPRFCALLRENVSRMGSGISVANACIGSPAAAPRTLREHKGTACLSDEAAGPRLRMEPLGAVLAQHPRFRRARFVKIDTDGYDVHIIRCEQAWLRASRALLFFEYDPHRLAAAEPEDARSLSFLTAAGYSRLLIYRNDGTLLEAGRADDAAVVRGILQFCADRARYVDICAFFPEDDDLFEQLRQRESGTQEGPDTASFPEFQIPRSDAVCPR